MSLTWDEAALVFDRVRAFSAEVEQRLAACRALPPETIYEQLYAMEGDDLPPLPMETDALLRYTLLKAHEGLLFYVRKWLVNADGDMTAESAIDEMCADRQLDLLFREPPLAEVLRFPRRMTGGKANCMKCGRELPMWSDEPGADLTYAAWLDLACSHCGTTPRQNGAR